MPPRCSFIERVPLTNSRFRSLLSISSRQNSMLEAGSQKVSSFHRLRGILHLQPLRCRKKISLMDRNWHGDAERLCLLADVAALVSSDREFIKEGFEALYQPSLKHFFSRRICCLFLAILW